MKCSRNARLNIIRAIWIIVGASLIWRATPYVSEIESTLVLVIALVAALVIGVGKGLFVLSKSARRTSDYIQKTNEPDFFWLFVHPMFWLLIPVMILAGWALRKYMGAEYPALIVGVYFGIGFALIAGAKGFSAKSEA